MCDAEDRRCFLWRSLGVLEGRSLVCGVHSRTQPLKGWDRSQSRMSLEFLVPVRMCSGFVCFIPSPGA